MHSHHRDISWHRMTSHFMHLGQIIHSFVVLVKCKLSPLRGSSFLGDFGGAVSNRQLQPDDRPIMLHRCGCPELPTHEGTILHIQTDLNFTNVI